MVILIFYVEVHVFFHDRGSVGDSGSVILFPDVFDLMGGLSFDH